MYAKNVNINPCNMCMPMGGVLAFTGIAGAMTIIHGSQGCSTYIRRHIAEHYNEPLDVASSSLNEKGTVYGGESNLKQGLANLIRIYKPKVIGVLTTCLAETIGEDIERIVQSYQEEHPLNRTLILPVHTPGYGGSHSEGFFHTLRKITEQLAGTPGSGSGPEIGVVVPNISPADIRELKRILDAFKLRYVLLPDYSGTMDGGYHKNYKKISQGGTSPAEIASLSKAGAILEFSTTAADAISPGVWLNERFGIPLFRIPLPIGLENTDRLMGVLAEIRGRQIPKVLQEERARFLDGMIDSHKHNAQGKAVIFQEPELLVGTVSLLRENGVEIALAATGSEKSLAGETLRKWEIPFMEGADFEKIVKAVQGQEVNLAIGNSDGRYLTEKHGIPLVRAGFPIHDRMGGGRLRSLGYPGSMEMLDRVTNTLLEYRLGGYRSRMREELLVTGQNEAETGGGGNEQY